MLNKNIKERLERLERKTSFEYRKGFYTSRGFDGVERKGFVRGNVDINDVVREILNHLNLEVSVPTKKPVELVKTEEDVKED